MCTRGAGNSWGTFGQPTFNLKGPMGAGIQIKGTGDAAAVEALIAAGTPNTGDAYILSGGGPHDMSATNAALNAVPDGHLVAFNGTDWQDVGQIQGPPAHRAKRPVGSRRRRMRPTSPRCLRRLSWPRLRRRLRLATLS